MNTLFQDGQHSESWKNEAVNLIKSRQLNNRERKEFSKILEAEYRALLYRFETK